MGCQGHSKHRTAGQSHGGAGRAVERSGSPTWLLCREGMVRPRRAIRSPHSGGQPGNSAGELLVYFGIKVTESADGLDKGKQTGVRPPSLRHLAAVTGHRHSRNQWHSKGWASKARVRVTSILRGSLSVWSSKANARPAWDAHCRIPAVRPQPSRHRCLSAKGHAVANPVSHSRIELSGQQCPSSPRTGALSPSAWSSLAESKASATL